MAHAARLHLHESLARAGIGHDDGGEFDRLALTARNDSLNRVCHDEAPFFFNQP
jgi:hypothetical protein